MTHFQVGKSVLTDLVRAMSTGDVLFQEHRGGSRSVGKMIAQRTSVQDFLHSAPRSDRHYSLQLLHTPQDHVCLLHDQSQVILYLAYLDRFDEPGARSVRLIMSKRAQQLPVPTDLQAPIVSLSSFKKELRLWNVSRGGLPVDCCDRCDFS